LVPNDPSGRAKTTGADLAPEQLLAHPSLWRRLAMMALVAVAAWPVVAFQLLLA
jgi:hypothetical protein